MNIANSANQSDGILVAGIMSTTLAVFLKERDLTLIMHRTARIKFSPMNFRLVLALSFGIGVFAELGHLPFRLFSLNKYEGILSDIA
jgi:uncharacterized YccA/Bax inhibitor family protein